MQGKGTEWKFGLFSLKKNKENKRREKEKEKVCSSTKSKFN